MLTMAIPNNGL